MNSIDLKKRVSDLKRKKLNNEKNVPMEVLTNKYKVPYTALCNDLKTSQAELKAAYMNTLREIAEIISDGIYAEPDQEYEMMRKKFIEIDAQNNHDPLLRHIMSGIASFGED